MRQQQRPGITPAWAGKRPCGSSSHRPCRDHPRVGGEKLSRHLVPDGVNGSPPRGRGKVQSDPCFPFVVRITPAWAGKSVQHLGFCNACWDHPRVGGEKIASCTVCRVSMGSPPRGRGKALTVCRRLSSLGITPAWAGKRDIKRAEKVFKRDHPRVGGEKLPEMLGIPVIPGSPPRGRGKECARTRRVYPTGITPAWAGKRLKRSHRSGIFISGPIPFHSVLHRPAGSGGSRAGRDGSPAGQPQNTGPA